LLKKLKPYQIFIYSYLIILILGLTGLMMMEKGDMIMWWAERRSTFWTSSFMFANELGEEWGFIFVGLYFLFVIPYRAIAVALDGLLISIVTQSLKFLLAQPRPLKVFGGNIEMANPVENWHVVDGMNSLPSGHTSAAFAFVSLLCVYAKNRPVVQFVLVLIATLGGMARIYSVNHFLIDVLLGSLVGVIIGFAVGFLTERYIPENWQRFRIFKNTK
jgi:membrane-associated phospholipid phosphatase